jgi:hypothetical protein
VRSGHGRDLIAGPEVDHATATAIGNGRDAARSVLELTAVKTLELSDQATAKHSNSVGGAAGSIAAR